MSSGVGPSLRLAIGRGIHHQIAPGSVGPRIRPGVGLGVRPSAEPLKQEINLLMQSLFKKKLFSILI